MPVEMRLRTAAWYGDREIWLEIPAGWELTAHWPRLMAALSDDDMAAALERPAGQPAVRDLCRGKSRPLVIVDDPNRPTPAACVLPHLLRHFRDAGIAAAKVTILVAAGTHRAPRAETLAAKIGPGAAACRVLVHDASRDSVRAGVTSFGTPVFLNREVMSSDFVIGIGGVYPNFTAGFGGGSKLILGALAIRSIAHLHSIHPAMGWGGSEGANTFRRDLDEIARMARLYTAVAIHVNEERKPARVVCGDHFAYHPAEVEFCRASFAAPAPSTADVVIANAYPGDLSLTFARMKGFAPLRMCPPGASRIAVAACSEGLGYHGLFPFLNAPRFHRLRKAYRFARIHGTRAMMRRLCEGTGSQAAPARNPILLYRPGGCGEPLPQRIPGIRVCRSWDEILERVRAEQRGKARLNVQLYPCAALQFPEIRPAAQEESCQESSTAAII